MNVTMELALAAACLVTGMAWGETAKFGAVVGYWRFNEAPYKADSSAFANDLTTFASGVAGASGTGSAENGYDGSAYLDITTAKAKVTTTLTTTLDTSKAYTYMLRIKPKDVSLSGYGALDDEIVKLLDTLKDGSKWHFAAFRYEPDQKMNANFKRMIFTDPTYGDRYGKGGDGAATDGTRAEASIDDDSSVYFPVNVLGSSLSIGGEVGASGKFIVTITKKADFKGAIDEVMVVNRALSKHEFTRYYHACEWPYVYTLGNVKFTAAGNWSSSEGSLAYAPSDLPGADFIVDNGCTVAADAAAFGGGSLTLGRLAVLKSKVDGTQMATEIGNLVQSAANVTIPDLRLNNGKLTASAGTALATTKLTVNATEENPYEVNVASGTYAVTGAALGDGWMKKTGAGTLDLTGLTGSAKVIVTEGKVLAGPNVMVTYDLEEDRGTVPVLMAE